MKHSTMLSYATSRPTFSNSFLSLILLFLFAHKPLAAETPQKRSTTLRERAMNAEQQLREYRQQVHLSKEKFRGISSVHSEVGIRIDRASKTSSTIFFYDNMESGANGWTTAAYTGSDIWQQTTLNASSPTHSWWPGVALQSNYDNGTRIDNALISPAINLTSDVAPIELLFTENYVTERGWDYCMVDVSTNAGINWTHLRGGYGAAPAGSSDGWIITTLDLSAFAGQTERCDDPPIAASCR